MIAMRLKLTSLHRVTENKRSIASKTQVGRKTPAVLHQMINVKRNTACAPNSVADPAFLNQIFSVAGGPGGKVKN